MTIELWVGFGVIAALLLFIVWKLSTMRGGTGQGDGQQVEQLRMELSRLDGAIRAQLQSNDRQLADLRKTVTDSQHTVNEMLDKKLTQVRNESRIDREAMVKVLKKLPSLVFSRLRLMLWQKTLALMSLNRASRLFRNSNPWMTPNQ